MKLRKMRISETLLGFRCSLQAIMLGKTPNGEKVQLYVDRLE